MKSARKKLILTVTLIVVFLAILGSLGILGRGIEQFFDLFPGEEMKEFAKETGEDTLLIAKGLADIFVAWMNVIFAPYQP
jgi:hypothetical protein